ncbi:hypothetical protein GW17_00002479, partial [Ensete ventricosum]
EKRKNIEKDWVLEVARRCGVSGSEFWEMGVLKYEVVGKFALFAFLLLDLLVGSVGGDVVLIGRNVSLSFPDIEANFVTTKLFLFVCSAPSVKGSGECGVLYVAEPLDACAPLTNEVAEGLDSPFALIIRGGCTFDVKVRSAQNAGFKAAIVYNNEDRGALISSKVPFLWFINCIVAKH